MDEQIEKEIHPQEYKAKKDHEREVAEQEKQRVDKMKGNMAQLDKEVKKTVKTFMTKAKKLKSATKKR